jgi:hypothetical protein
MGKEIQEISELRRWHGLHDPTWDFKERWATPTQLKELDKQGYVLRTWADRRGIKKVERLIKEMLKTSPALVLTHPDDYIRKYAELIKANEDKTWQQTLEKESNATKT